MAKILFLVSVLLLAMPVWAQKNINPRVLGNAKAPLTMVEYASFTCPHCAHFHTDIMPQLKKDFIDAGKLKLIYDDFPLDGLALGVSVMARCIDNDNAYFAFVDQIFKTQKNWVESSDPKGVILKSLGFAGVSPEMAEKCLGNKQLVEKINQSRENAVKLGVQSTPTLMINQKIIKYNDYNDLKNQITKLLPKK